MVIVEAFNIEVEIIKVNNQMIHCGVIYMGIGRKFWVTMVYAYNDMTIRRPLWNDERIIVMGMGSDERL